MAINGGRVAGATGSQTGGAGALPYPAVGRHRLGALGWRARTVVDATPRLVWLTIITLFGALVVVEAAILVGLILEAPGSWEFGQDYTFYRDIAARWLAEGTYYLPRQLAGPYELLAMADVLYPPSALPLFVLAVCTPAVVWWAIPAAVLGVAVFRWRPSIWAVALGVVLMAWPRSIGYVLFGNTDIWVMAAVAGGLLWGWPAAFIVLKPSLVPLALLGSKSRSWFVVMSILVVTALLTLPAWLDYLTAMRNIELAWDYSLGSLPLILVPLALWAGRRSGTTQGQT